MSFKKYGERESIETLFKGQLLYVQTMADEVMISRVTKVPGGLSNLLVTSLTPDQAHDLALSILHYEEIARKAIRDMEAQS